MVYTVTFNPSIDYIVTVNDFQTGKTNRTADEYMLPGGKGINVSTVLTNLGIPTTALGFIAGFTGDEIERKTKELGIRTDFIRIPEGISRINVKLTSIDGTEINGMGPNINAMWVERLMQQLGMLTEGDILVLAGSVPESVSRNIYGDILAALQGRNVTVVVDATKSLLMNALPYHPFLVKPNKHELGEMYGVTLKTTEEVVEYARLLKQEGAANVLVSMGGEGAVLVAADEQVYRASAPAGKLRNSVGAGDSMVAGFLAGWLKAHTYEEAFRMSVACGSASAYSDNLTTAAETNALYVQVIVNK